MNSTGCPGVPPFSPMGRQDTKDGKGHMGQRGTGETIWDTCRISVLDTPICL